MSFLIDPPWLYANGRIAAELPEPTQKPLTAATARGLPRDEHPPVPQPAVDALDLAAVPRRGRPRLDAQLRRLLLRPRDAGPRTHAASALLFATYPVWMWLGLRHGRR